MSEHAPWQRAAHGAMLLGASGALAPTIFAEMSALALQHDAVNLGQGFPDYDGPAELLEGARAEIASGANQYPPGRGYPELRDAIAAHQSAWYGVSLDPASEVLVTAGATEALAATILAFVQPGDEVVTIEPFYDAYGALIELAGGTHVTMALNDDLTLSAETVKQAITDRTRIVLLNNPVNPTGTVLGREILEAIADAGRRHDALIVTDEVYEHLLFDGRQHTTIAQVAAAADRCLTISSAGKTFSVTGWKTGWISGPAHLIDAVATVKQYLTFVNGSPFQRPVARSLALPHEWFLEQQATLQRRRDLLVDVLTGVGFDVTIPDAGYFVIADAAPLGITDGAEFCRRLPAEIGVAAVPISAFCRGEMRERLSSRIRLAFCKQDAALEEAARRLAKLARR